ncbi:MAG: ATP-binding protein [Chloroflexota bacterium]|nr:MAG: hypothetical protein DIU68_03325 [Chloroflexota bacterium]
MAIPFSAIQLSDTKDHITYLRADAFKVIIAIILGCAYIWLTATVWPTTGSETRIEAWIGSLLLMAGSSASLFFHRQRTLAYFLLLSSLFIATILATIAYNLSDLLYLLVVTVLFSSVLLGQLAVLIFGMLSAGAALWVMVSVPEVTAQHSLLLPPLVIIAATFTALASVRNLYTALHWATKSYERIEHNERLLQEQQSELKQALKSLDAATYNLERANVMLALARNRADQALRLKQEFAQNMSHELRTPLNLIVGFSEAMMQSPEYYGGPLPAAYLRDLSIVYRNAVHLQGLVNDVLDLARLEAAQMTITTEEVDPGVLISEATETIRGMVESRGLFLRTNIPSDLPSVHVDPTRIRQVIFNILNNAIRFTECGGITVSVSQQDDQILVAIQDTGIGIEEAELPRIFEAFHQSESTPERRRGGIGLGLAISKQFIELHGGRIWAESRYGHGSTFYFTLPLRTTATYLGQTWPTNEPIAYPGYASDRERVVLVVTRSPSGATMLARYLQNCRTVFVDNLEQARAFASRGAPQLVIIDNACETLTADDLTELARTWKLEHVHFITCPLPGEEQLRQRLATHGYLIKPLARNNLLDAVMQLPGQVNSVLIVDDDADFVRLITRMLNHPVRRYQISTAYSGREALAKLNHHKPDLILMDIGLPDISGLKVLENIRNRPDAEDIFVIMVSGHDDIDIVEALPGAVTITCASGLARGDVIQWIQRVLDTSTRINSPRPQQAETP